ncbi:MAG TPA: ATP-binding protein [Polyangia bacterium]
MSPAEPAPAPAPGSPPAKAAGAAPGRRRLTLRARLALLQIVVFGGLLAAGPATYLVLSRSLDRDLDHHLAALARLLAARFTEDLPASAGLPRRGTPRCPMRRDPLRHPPRHLLVFDAETGVVCSDGEPHALAPEAVAHALAHGAPAHADLQLADESMRLLAWPFTDGRGRRLVLEVGTSNEAILQALRRSATAIFSLSGAALLLLIVGSYLLARRAFAPIDRIVRRVEQIDELNLAERIPLGRGSDELARLTVVMNRMLARLQAAFEGQRRFASDVSHEIRSPLTSLRGQIEVALRKERPPAEYRRVLEENLEEVLRLSRLAENLLSLARADAGVLEIQHLRVDLREVLGDAVRRLSPRASEKNVRLELVAPAPAAVTGDPDWLGRLVENLVDNAVRHTPQMGRVRVALRAGDGAAVIAIEDTGEGIPAEDLPHLFERFFRVDRSRSRDKGGAGLGLAISQQIAVLHGGRIQVRSTVGQGSAFEVVLPLAAGGDGDD